MFVVDTNILVYAANTTYPEHDRCRELVEEWRDSSRPWHSTWPIVYEFLRVVTHRKVWAEPWSGSEAWSFITSLMVSSGFSLLVETSQHTELVETMLTEYPDLEGNIFHDAHTVVLMREHGIRRIYTRDTDFRRFSFLEVVDPMRERE